MNILIDSREKGRRFRASKHYTDKGHDTQVQTLDVGDYVFDDRVVFEYKEIGDFMGSVLNESVFNEALNQAQVFEFHYVLVQGNLWSWLESNWRYVNNKWHNRYDKYLHSSLGRYFGALRRLRTFTCPVLVETEEQAFDEMLLQAIKCLDGKSRFYSNVTRPVPSQDPVDVLLTSCKGVSSKKAKLIKETLNIKNINDLINCSVEDFNKVKSIGEITANNIYSFIHEGDETYEN